MQSQLVILVSLNSVFKIGVGSILSRIKRSNLLILFSILSVLTISLTIIPASALLSQNTASWFWTSDTRIVASALGDVNGDGFPELVTAGYYNDGIRWNTMLHVLNRSTLAIENVAWWNWGSDTQISALAIGDVNNDGINDIVAVGSYFDGVNWEAVIHVLDISTTSTSFTIKNVGWWKFGNDTELSAVAIGDVNGDGIKDIVTAGSYFDGVRRNTMLHVFDANPTTGSYNLLNVGWWNWGSDTYLNSVAVGNVTGSTTLDIVTAGTYFDGVHNSAMLHVLGASTTSTAFVIRNVGWWNWGGDTVISAVAIGNLTGGAINSIVTGGYYSDGLRTNSMLHVFAASTTSTAFTIQAVTWWYRLSNTNIKSVAIGNFTGSAALDIVTLGVANDGTRNNAQLRVFAGAPLAFKSEADWFTTSNTEGNAVVIDNTASGGRITTCGQFFDNTFGNAQIIIWG
jgi:hypothetical protein